MGNNMKKIASRKTLPAQRVGVFVDVQNLFYSAKYQFHAKVDFSKLMDMCVNGRQLVRALAYVVQTPDIDQTSFLNILDQIGFEIKSKDLRMRPDGTAKGDWDMGMAIDSISMAERLDVIVLVSGDGDFVDLVNMLKSRGVIVEVLSFPNNTAEDLKDAAIHYIPLGKNVLYNSGKITKAEAAAPNGD
jgi:uncharacterized LabA/DUF88 family protein